MSPKTKRRVFVSLVMLALTLPAEVVLLKALQSPNDKVAATEWAAELDDGSLRAAAQSIQSYSVAYRRAIMGALSPDRRAAVWRYHIDQYVANHRNLDDAAVGALRAARAALTPTVLGEKATARERANLEAAGKVLDAVLGEDESSFITRDLGPRTTTLAGAEPLLDKLANYARNQFILMARDSDCECASDRDCGYYVAYCNTSYGCNVSTGWPMCGYFWNSPCNGMCSAL